MVIDPPAADDLDDSDVDDSDEEDDDHCDADRGSDDEDDPVCGADLCRFDPRELFHSNWLICDGGCERDFHVCCTDKGRLSKKAYEAWLAQGESWYCQTCRPTARAPSSSGARSMRSAPGSDAGAALSAK